MDHLCIIGTILTIGQDGKQSVESLGIEMVILPDSMIASRPSLTAKTSVSHCC